MPTKKKVNIKKRAKEPMNGTVQPPPRGVVRGWEVAPTISMGIPLVRSTRDRIVVRNRELIASPSATFAAGLAPTGGTALSLGFGAGSCFASTSWLYNLANVYDKYIVRKFRIIFQPILPVTTGGVVGTYFDSDTSAVVLTNYTQLSGNMNAKSAMIFDSIDLALTPDQLNRLPQYFTLNNGVAPTVQSTANVGVIQLVWSPLTLASGATGSSTIGYIWVDYEIEFLNPSSTAT